MNRHTHMPAIVGFQAASRLAACLLAALTASTLAEAQDAVIVDPPAHVSLVEGTVVLERDGRTDTSPGSMPLLSGDRLRTRDGRAEVLFVDGSTLHLDSETMVDFQSDEVIRLLEGRLRLNITGTTREVAYRVDTPTGWAVIDQPGAYRVSLLRGEREPELELAVVRGAAEIVNDNGRTLLRAGERAFARADLAPSAPYVFNSAAWDVFDQWSEARRAERLGATAEYLPTEVQPYATTFVQYGSWRHEPSYGYVWYPRVHAGWRPYYHGRWSHYRPWGWTWIGSDPWAWPTHHYGRWGFSAGVWFWIPGTVWGPAWVSWAYAPGYVSWCPLGWNNRPVFYFNTRYYHGGRYYDPWRAWTVVPHRRFGTGYVNAHVVSGTHIDARTRGAFVARSAGPNVQGYAVPRSATPIHVAGGRVQGGASGTPAYSATSPGRSAPNASTTLRGRRSAGEPLSGPGLPAPAREPRSSSTLRTAPSTAGQPARSRVPSVVSGETGTARRAEPRSGVPVSPSRTYEPSRRTAPSAPSGETGAARRAEPRSGAPASPSPTYDSPSRRPAPQYRATPSAPAASQSERAPSNPSERYRAVPRTGDRYSQAPPSAPSVQPDYGRRAPDYGRREPSGTSGYGVPRAVPRTGPESDGGPRTYRPSPGASERRAPSARPSGPPASAAPSRPSGSPPSAAPPSNRGGSGGESRPRGGQPSRGTARSRG